MSYDSKPEDVACTPLVSIVLPTYNRGKRFLADAFASIESQTCRDWELIVVDDGSTDDSGTRVRQLAESLGRDVRYVYQENGGAYAARNAGLDLARGEYVAFFDSDDVWLPHHLADCLVSLRANADVDWVYAASKVVDEDTGAVIEPNHIRDTHRGRGPLAIDARHAGSLRVLDTSGAMRGMILKGHLCLLQNSVIRRRVFDDRRFCVRHRNEAEDFLFVIRSVAAGFKIGFIDNVHSTYIVHSENSSAAARGISYEKHVRVYENFINGLEDLLSNGSLTGPDREAVSRKLGQECFWSLGYALHWQHGERDKALAMFRKGLQYCPWSLGFWKTYLFSVVRNGLPQRKRPLRAAEEAS